MKFEWDNSKREINLQKHGFDFADAEAVLSGAVYQVESQEGMYAETRYMVFGLWEELEVIIVYTMRGDKHRIISFRRAAEYERAIYWQAIKNQD